MSTTSKLGWVAGGAAVLLVGGILWQMSKTAADLIATPFFKVPIIPDFQRVVFPIDVKIKNPRPSSLKINFPFVELFVGKGENKYKIGDSQSKKELIEIPGHGEKLIQNILIEVPLLNLSGFAKPVIDFVRGKTREIDLTYRVTSTADAKLFTVPVDVEDSITISKGSGSAV